MEAMTPSRPFFVRAIFDWLIENECTPYISVFAGFPATQVPLEFVEDEHITLNISPTAVADFHFDNESISFKARFSGTSRQIVIPMGAITGMFAKENGHGMGFPDEPFYEKQTEGLAAEEGTIVPILSGLKSVSDTAAKNKPVEAASKDQAGEKAVSSKAKVKKKPPHLKVIK